MGVTKTFGNESTGDIDGINLKNAIISGKFQMGPTAGAADQVTAQIKYKGLGRLIKSFTSPSSTHAGLDVDSSDSLWSADADSSTIFKFDQSGSVISSFAFATATPYGLGVDSSDCIWVGQECFFNPGKLYQLKQDGSIVSSFQTPSNLPRGIGFDSSDCIWLADANQHVYQLKQDGTIISSFASPAGGEEYLGVDSSDCIWTCDATAHKIYKMNQTGTVLDSFASPSNDPAGMGLDSSDCIWTCDCGTDKTYKMKASTGVKIKCAIYDSNGNLVTNGVSDERTISSSAGTTAWLTFTFSAPKPSLTADDWYYIAVWAENLEGMDHIRLQYDNTGGYGIFQKTQTYNSFPSSISKNLLHSGGLAPVYCTYTITTPEKPYETYISGFEARYKKSQVVGYFTTSGDIRSIEVDASGHLLTSISGQSVVTQNGFQISGTVNTSVSGNIVQISGQHVTTTGGGGQVSGAVIVSGDVNTSVSGNIVQISGQHVTTTGGGGQVSGAVIISGDVNTSVSGNIVQISGQHVTTTGGGGGQVSGAVIISGDVNTSVSGNIVQISGQHVVTSATADISGDAIWISSGDISILSGHYMASGIHVVTSAVTADISGDVVNISGQNIRTGLATSMSTRTISVTAASGGTQLFGANNNRESIIVQNLLSGDIHLKESALQSGEGIKVQADGDWNSETYRGSLYAVANISGNKISVMEESL